MLTYLDRLDDRELERLLSSLERRVRSALALGDAEIAHCLLDEYLEANEEYDRRFTLWNTDRASDGAFALS
jgi:hypothetical protein